MADEKIASGRIEIKIDDEEAIARLRKLDSVFDRTMRDIDRQEATVNIDGNLAKFNDAVTNAKRELRKLEKEKAEIELKIKDGDNEKLEADIKKARAEVKRLDGIKAEAELKYNHDPALLKAYLANLKLAEARQKALDDANKRRLKASVDAEKRAAKEKADAEKWLSDWRVKMSKQRAAEEKAAELEAHRLNDKLNKEKADREKWLSDWRVKMSKQRAAEEKAAEAEAHRLNDKRIREEMAWRAKLDKVRKSLADQRSREMDQAERDAYRQDQIFERELASVPKVRREYAQLAKQIDDLNASRRKVKHDVKAVAVVDLKIEEAAAKMKAHKAFLERIGSPVDIAVDVHPGRDAGAAIRNVVRESFRDRGAFSAAREGGRALGVAFNIALAKSIDDTFSRRAIRRNIGQIGSRITNALSNLSQMTVRIGPFTATIRQAIVALSLLGPIIINLVGALGALVGVVGSATLGVTALTGAFLGGAIPAALGMGLVVKDVAQEFTAAKKATKAYNDTVMKHGKDSDKAKKKLDELRNVMGAVSETTAKQFIEGQKLGKVWDRITKPAHASVWRLIGTSLETAGNLMPMFGKNTNEAMAVAEKGTRRWLRALDSVEGRAVLNTLMDNFRKSLGPVLSGMGNLVGYFAKVSAYASGALPGLARTFERWAKGLNATADGSENFRNRIDKIIQSSKDLGRFLMSAGRLMKAFFGAGVDSGQGFLNTMTKAMDRWTAFLRTTEGKRGLQDFFKGAVEGTQAFWAVLQPVLTTFVRWAQMISPFITGVMQLASAFTSAAAALLRLTGLKGPLTALVTTLGVLWGIGKIGAATRAVIGFTQALLGMAGAQRAVAASSAMAGGAGIAGGIGGGFMARQAMRNRLPTTDLRAASNLGKTARAAGVARTAMTGLGAATIGLSNPLAGLAVLAVGAGVGLYALAKRTKDHEKATSAAAEAQKRANVALQMLPQINADAAQTGLSLIQSRQELKDITKQSADEERRLNELREAGKKGTREYNDLNAQHKNTLNQVQQARLNQNQALQRGIELQREEKKASREALVQAEKRVHLAAKASFDLGGKRTGGANVMPGFEKISTAYDKISRSAKAAGQTLREYVEANRNVVGSVNIDRLEQYGKAFDKTKAAQRAQMHASNLAALSTINMDRALRGVVPIAVKAAGAFGKLSRSAAGKKLATQISLKYDDPSKAAKVGGAASRALQAGAKPARIRIIVDGAKNAEEAVRKLNRLELKTKIQDIRERGGAKAVAMIERIIGRNLSTKEQKIVERGGPKVMQQLERIGSTSLREKIQQILERGGGGVRATLNAIASIRLPDKTQNIFINTHRSESRSRAAENRGAFTRGPARRQGASGKTIGASWPNALIGEGKRDEWRVDMRRGQVYKTDGPEFTRLSKDDAIIPTEQRFRDRGRDVFRRIAEDLGISMFAKSKKPARKAPAPRRDMRQPAAGRGPKPRQKVPFGSFGESDFRPDAQINRERVFNKKRSKTRKPFSIKRGWADYIEGLHTQQGYWEREVSIRESQVKEPADVIIPIGENTVKDPVTGEVEKIPIYGPNPAIENTYKPQLRAVMQAMQTLLAIVAELVRAIPQAVAANRQERNYHRGAEDSLNDGIAREKRRMKGKKGRNRDKHEEAIERKRKARDKHKEAREELVEAEKQLLADRVEAGFDFREVSIGLGDIRTEHDTAAGDATAAAIKENISNIPKEPSTSEGGGGGGGGAGSDQLSYGQQAALADTERANVLREFGSNMMSAVGASVLPTGGMAGGSGPGGANAAMRDPNTPMGMNRSAGAMAVSSGRYAGGSWASSSGTGGGAGGGNIDQSRNTTIVNNFQQPPPDAHTFVKGMEFEMEGTTA